MKIPISDLENFLLDDGVMDTNTNIAFLNGEVEHEVIGTPQDKNVRIMGFIDKDAYMWWDVYVNDTSVGCTATKGIIEFIQERW